MRKEVKGQPPKKVLVPSGQYLGWLVLCWPTLAQWLDYVDQVLWWSLALILDDASVVGV